MSLEHVIYVDDEADIRAVVEMSLTMVGGFHVTLCDGGGAALETIPRLMPDLVLLDVMMPGIDGPTVLKRLRDRADPVMIPVVFMTAKVQPGEIERFLALGAVDVISKPFDPLTLPDQVRAIWARLGRD